MNAEIRFDKDGAVARCGREIDPSSWIIPILNDGGGYDVATRDCSCHEGAEDVCVNILCPRKTLKADAVEEQKGIVGIVVRQGISRTRLAFVKDLSKSMIDVGCGYDPYNHVGIYVVTSMLGVKL